MKKKSVWIWCIYVRANRWAYGRNRRPNKSANAARRPGHEQQWRYNNKKTMARDYRQKNRGRLHILIRKSENRFFPCSERTSLVYSRIRIIQHIIIIEKHFFQATSISFFMTFNCNKAQQQFQPIASKVEDGAEKKLSSRTGTIRPYGKKKQQNLFIIYIYAYRIWKHSVAEPDL